ncbi:MAG TPA: hypothetical protein DEB06_02730 [Phycisphaerales bacterium]|nr:hypothetical protein [Phycisphaerales bacterium]
MKLVRALGVLVSLLTLATVCGAQDVLELRDGRIVRGQFVGGTANTVRFENQSGMVDVFGRDEVLALTFGATTAPPAATVVPPPAPAPPPAAAPPVPVASPAPARPANFFLPAGTILLVRTDQTMASNRNREGERFQATIEHDILADGQVAVPRGTRVFGRIAEIRGAGRVAGRPEIRLRLREIDMNGRLVEIRTSSFNESGASSFAGTARNAGLGAGIGAAFNGGTGAARGAAIGGATSVLSAGDVITIPSGTVLEFRLTQAAQIPGN